MLDLLLFLDRYKHKSCKKNYINPFLVVSDPFFKNAWIRFRGDKTDPSGSATLSTAKYRFLLDSGGLCQILTAHLYSQ